MSAASQRPTDSRDPLDCPLPGCDAWVPGERIGPDDNPCTVYEEGASYTCEVGHKLYFDSAARGGFFPVDDHEKDADCAEWVKQAGDRCPICNLSAGPPCPTCGGRSYHAETCPAVTRPGVVVLAGAGR